MIVNLRLPRTQEQLMKLFFNFKVLLKLLEQQMHL
jgi:hypothetical protein